jgi:hypothetical protein
VTIIILSPRISIDHLNLSDEVCLQMLMFLVFIFVEIGFGLGFWLRFRCWISFFSSFLLMVIVRLMRVLVPNENQTSFDSTCYACPICMFGFLYHFISFCSDLFRSVPFINS